MSNKKTLGIGVFVAVITTGAWLIVRHQLDTDTSGAEPGFGAAYRHHSQVVFSRKEPLNFGALVGGYASRFIKLSPDGEILTSAPIVDQSSQSYIGDLNARRFSGSHRYQVQPGRLTFKVASRKRNQYVLVKFLPGELKSGVKLELLDIERGPDTDHVAEIVSSHKIRNEVLFKINRRRNHRHSSGMVVIDLLYGGTLKLHSHVGGDVRAQMEVEVSVRSEKRYW